MKTIVRIKFGSHLYGTSTPTSDIDFKSVHVPSSRDILLQRVKGSVGDKREKSEGEKNVPGDVDDESYALHRYLGLLAEGQTVAIDMLFAPSPVFSNPLWDHIQKNSERFLTKKSAAFVGYCRTQANKYGIKGSRVAAAKKAVEFFSSAVSGRGTTAKVGDFILDGLIDEHTRITEKETTPGKTETYFECCNRMVGFKNTVKEAHAIFSRIYEEYGARARQAQTNEGIDWKALSHAVRVGNEALELLRFHTISFPLANASHILEIKQGKRPYQEVAEEIEDLLVSVEEASRQSSLPDESDRKFIDDLVEHVYRNEIIYG